MALRSSNSSIVDRLLAAKASEKSRPRGGLTSAHDAPFRAQASATMSPDERRALVQRMLQQRKQAAFSDSPSSPQIESHRPEEASRDMQAAPVSMAPAYSPQRQAFRPGELISPASSHEGSTRAQPAGKSPAGFASRSNPDAFPMRELSESSNAPLQQYEQHHYEADSAAETPALQACVSPQINIKGGTRNNDVNGSPERLGTSHLQPQPPEHRAPSSRPPTPQRPSKEAPSHFLTNAPSPGADLAPEKSYAQSYGPTAAEPLIMEMSSMVLRGEPSDASVPNPDSQEAANTHPYMSTDSQQGAALRMGPSLAPEFSWQSTCASDSIPGGTEAPYERCSAAQPQISHSRAESTGRESSAAQSLYFACDLLADGNSARVSQQHTAESSGSFQNDPLNHGAAALRAAQEQQRQQAAHCRSAMACSTTSGRSMNSELIDRAAAVDPFCAPPMPTAEYSAAATDVSANLSASDWHSKATNAWGCHEYSPAIDTAQSGPDIHHIRATQSLPVGAMQDSAQLDTVHASYADSWDTQSASAPEKEPLAGHHRVGRSGQQRYAEDVDLTATVGRGGTAGQAHKRGKTRQEVLEEVMRERAAKGRQPRSHSARPGARPRTAGARSTTAGTGAGSQRIEELARPRSIERYTARQKDAEEDELRECTFAPQITSRRSASARRAPHRRDLSIPAGERLHHAHDHVAKVRTRKQTEAMKEELAACTFTPQLHPPPSNIAKKPYVPLHERAATLVKQKNARLDQTRMNQELFDPQATFAPALNQRSIRLAALAAARKSKRPLHASMPGGGGPSATSHSARHPSDSHSAGTAHGSSEASFNPAWAFPPGDQKLTQTVGHAASPRMGSMRASSRPRTSRRSRSASPGPWKGAEPSDSKDCTFAPAVNVATDAYLQKAGIPTTFEERQAFYEQRRHVQAHVQQAALDPECTFRPQTAHPEAILAASSRRVHLEETQEEFWLRMTTEASRRECMLRAIDNVQQQQFTFAPSINPRSRRMARSKNVEELATDPQRHAFREAAAAAAEQRLTQECTFMPDTSKPGVPGTSGVEPKAPFTVCGQKSENIIERIHEYKDGRSRKLEQVRNRREWAELQECTFAPKTNKSKPKSRASSQAPVLVRGLDAHMSKLERAKKLAADEAARRAKIFLEEPKAPRAKFTIAKPFNISENQAGRDLKKMQLQEERRAQSMRECTFKPETNEGKKRQILQQILAAEPPLMC